MNVGLQKGFKTLKSVLTTYAFSINNRVAYVFFHYILVNNLRILCFFFR